MKTQVCGSKEGYLKNFITQFIPAFSAKKNNVELDTVGRLKIVLTLDSYTQPPLLPQHAPDAPRELHVLHHDRDSFGVDRTQVRVLKEAHQMSLRGLLQSHERGRLPAEVVRGQTLLDLSHSTT